MRLVCPNCDAEYEVDASVIPDGGRDVQCSNCGNAWFQLPPEVEAERAAEEALYDAPPPMAPAVHDKPEAKTPNTGLDAQMLAVLKEEAEREVQARRAEVQPMETQPELGLETPAAGGGIGGAVARRLARLKGNDTDPPVAKGKSRREAFPEIEEINSTLRPSTEKRDSDSANISDGMSAASVGKSAFRTGFSLVLLLAVLAIAAYVMAPELRQQIPGAAGLIDAYVAQVNAARLGLDATLKTMITWLHGMA